MVNDSFIELPPQYKNWVEYANEVKKEDFNFMLMEVKIKGKENITEKISPIHYIQLRAYRELKESKII